MKFLEDIQQSDTYRKYRFEILSAGVFSIILAVVLYVLLPLAGSDIETFSGLLDRKQSVSEAQDFEKNLKKMIQQNNTLREKAATLKMNISNANSLSNIYAMMNKASGESGITVTVINTMPEEKGKNYIRLRFNLELKGPYNAFGGFLENIEDSGYIVSVDELFVENSYTSNLTGKADVSLYLYSQQ
ncbi:MAG: hypothetical protein A2268_02265 [Candidatus Raymondbacteria bacterium RifOxyA12_full_50_37]|uniref:Pilus assembly protein PilO n=1 Tax=Candidatus Raymondbacteria bacterium RIFOXYD12_FULL_49_13 TaxID=1817890 RepID=A0A1F7F5T5_UNCRA|nr:MAG: hypothetical protein A2350_07790 [Candidatus Raymondbacteria bacterium RifOxyB12_full_50_8]OGJ91279.1 MAG: hypothetical protein A2268_02265 [Candidatus Raymondbacteria bacterium RifOxyA12_full_50_37]OGJ92249.1 MAG: hypothetical protein A2248_11095 [Candidatus Raymondbacteria bacterium RIFOXYA2_FULL_49_16]OGJ98575.1 MAG: hypothetical protein A2453_06895 [Candidatus Raymondbacteria bacterium RIFOXYC2_FULL_50_21]OGK01876.1 MAG: hypothetical protein A2519_04790 [Candidatus Raymondbacteria b